MRTVREPAVAGRFYPGTSRALGQAILDCYESPLGPGRRPQLADRLLSAPRVLIVPHAGYVYSGPIAAWGYAEMAQRGRPAVTVLLGPNHRGMTLADTIETSGAWRTPLGEAPIDSSVAARILEACPELDEDPAGGRYEHSIEVQLPFLQELYGADTPIVPIMVSSHGMQALRSIAAAVASALPPSGLIVCSTDLTHFLPAEGARTEDAYALDAIARMDAGNLAEVVRERRISMCGWAATATGLLAARQLGLTDCRVLRYGHSGHASGDDSSVVAYATALVE